MRRHKAGVLFTLYSALLAVPPPAGSTPLQEGDTQTFDEEIDITEVLLDVVVTDRRGNPVVGLGKDDFLVEENGHEMALTGADFYTTRYRDDPTGPGTSAIPASRYFIFFFHDVRAVANRFNRLTRRQSDAARQSRRWVQENMQPSDWVAVAGFGGRLKVFHDFTQDREALFQALLEAERSRDPEKSRWTREPAGAGAPSLLRELPTSQKANKKTREIHTALRRLAEASGHVAGRKTLLYFGIGFGDVEVLDRSAVPDRRRYPALERALNDANVAVYPIDLTAQGSRHSQSAFLNTLATDTGGVYYRNFVSFARPLRSIARENTAYYLLSYRSGHPSGERGYQRVRVRARTPGLVVRAQRGYRYGEP